jgi:D-galactose 1-dehydrogenase
VIAIGIVGMGKIARDQHLPAIAASADFELVAIADPAAPAVDLPSYRDCAAMLAAHPEIAAVSLCMPPRFRAASARDAIAAGRHVLLEKPPCASLAEAEALASLASQAGVTLFTAWHSQKGAAVAAAREWLEGRAIKSVRVTWKEDVRVWHPGQAWIWQEGGFGVFDPGINALSILTTILPGELRLLEADLSVPADCATPIAARLSIASDSGIPVTAEFDFRQTGPQSWDIDVEAADGFLRLSHGGNRLDIDGHESPVPGEGEYPALYARFAELVGARQGEVDLAPLRLAEEALLKGRVATVAPFDMSDTEMEEPAR